MTDYEQFAVIYIGLVVFGMLTRPKASVAFALGWAASALVVAGAIAYG